MLKLTNITKTYSDGTQALKNITLSLPAGMVGLLGPNGAGKSSLMRTLACLQRPDQGKIIFDDFNSLKEPDRLRSQLGYLPQYFGGYPGMSCAALLEHMGCLKGVARDKLKSQIDELLVLTNLTPVANKKVSTLSGGTRQRFGIAQALLGNPRLIIMDEPTSGLDPAERERLHNLLVSISDERLILLSTHIVEDIENLCRHVAIINQGEILDSGCVQTLIKPLREHIWQTPSLPDKSSEGKILSRSYRFGKPNFRIFCHTQPNPEAVKVEANLQDRYFYELNQSGI